MKLIIFFAGLFALQVSAFSIPDEDVQLYRALQQSGISPYVMEAQVRAWLEGVFQSLRDKGLDPLDVDEKAINITNQLIDLKGNVQNAHLENLLNITISDLKLTVIPLSLTARLSWDWPISGHTEYDIDGNLLQLIPVFGKGHAEGHVDGLFVYFSASLTSKNNSVVIRTLDLDFGINDINLSATGLLGGDLGTLICEIINDEAVTLVGQFKDGYMEYLKKGVTAVVNKALEGKTIQDIIDMITGKTTTPKPTTEASEYMFH